MGTLLQHPVFDNDVRDIPDSQVEDWKAAGWKSAKKSVDAPVVAEPEPAPEPTDDNQS